MPAHWLSSKRVVQTLLAIYDYVPFWNHTRFSRNRDDNQGATDETIAKSGRSYRTNVCKLVNRELDFP
jgi:hypothetical protein